MWIWIIFLPNDLQQAVTHKRDNFLALRSGFVMNIKTVEVA